MSFCHKCMTSRVLQLSAKCNDMCTITIEGKSTHGYVPTDLGIGGGDYIYFSLCLKCGHVQGQWPLPEAEIEQPDDSQDEE